MHPRRLSLAMLLVACAPSPEGPDGQADEDSGSVSSSTSQTSGSQTGDTGADTSAATSADTTGETGADTTGPPPLCDGDPCEVFDECCDGQRCTDGTCQPQTCTEEDQPCDQALPCCGDFECAESGTCQYPAQCVGEGETCDAFFVGCCEPYVCNKDGFIDQCELP